MLAAFGEGKGGELRYWPDDDKSVSHKELEKLPVSKSMTVDLRKNLLLFDGQRCHEVLDWSGERYSLVWFSCARHWKAGKQALQQLRDLGFEIPTDSSLAAVSRALRRPGAASKVPGALTWPEGPQEPGRPGAAGAKASKRGRPAGATAVKRGRPAKAA